MKTDVDLKINNFNGPLDLLLELVKGKQMDIFDINLAELATEYVKLIEKLKETDINLASEYLVMAATLIQLKARILLETPEAKEEVNKESKDLIRQLVEHQQFKKVAEDLKNKEEKRDSIYIKETENYDNFQLEEDETKLDGSSNAVKLIMQMRKMFERINSNQLKETTIEKFNLSPAQRRVEIIKLLKGNSNPTFEEVFTVPSMNHFVVTMLTILDMSRKQELIIDQNEQFGNITLKKGVINE